MYNHCLYGIDAALAILEHVEIIESKQKDEHSLYENLMSFI